MNPVAQREAGFTLVELLVALMIFGMLSATGVALLSFSVKAQAAAGDRLDGIAALRRMNALLASDLAQAAARPHRDEEGRLHPAFSAPTGDGFTLVRRGWEGGGEDRPSLQKVSYRLRGGSLERLTHAFVDGAPPSEPAVLASGVGGARLRFRDSRGGWRDRWDPEDPAELPRAVELSYEGEGGRRLTQLFLTGGAS